LKNNAFASQDSGRRCVLRKVVIQASCVEGGICAKTTDALEFDNKFFNRFELITSQVLTVKDCQVVIVRVTFFFLHPAFYLCAFLPSLLVNSVCGFKKLGNFGQVVLLLQHQLLHQLHQDSFVIFSVNK